MLAAQGHHAAGMAGMAEVAARRWLATLAGLSRERVVELLAGLSWRGIPGSPLTS